MKKFLILQLLFFITGICFSNILIVDNNPNNGGAYTTISDAVAAAGNNDTIYIIGSSTNYAGATIDKPLVIMGPGRNPLTDQPVKATVSSDIVLSDAADSTEIYGIVFANLTCSGQADKVVISRCKGTKISVQGNYWLIENCVLFTGSTLALVDDLNGSNNIIIQNNIIFGCMQKFNSASVFVRNNLFVDVADAFCQWYGDPNYYLRVENNIFYGRSPANCSQCVFNKNVTFSTTQNDIPYDDNTGDTNYINIDPLFIDAPGVGSYNNNDVDLYNYQLSAASVVKNAGTDSTDVGIYGGNLPYTVGGEPPIPIIRKMELMNYVVGQDGILRLKINSSQGK